MSNLLKIIELKMAAGPLFSFSIAAGEVLCLSGQSGTGKTLLLRAIADLDPHQGAIWFNDQSMDSIPAPLWRKKIGLILSESYWWSDIVSDHFFDTKAAAPFLEALKLPIESLNWQTFRMSTGEKQRMSIARLLANKPLALLLDEPTANLDPDTTRRVESLILNYGQTKKAPILWVSHDPLQIKRIGHRHIHIEDDQIQEIPL
ncbi:MAG: ATP-binding cassette domain-containing protein [Magnetococcales bacterium]|nr:ATP-binding cassette domain-containing protein [Magnetococcales bacterium]